jgi:quercetin dioxygenase-like cupin family protein
MSSLCGWSKAQWNFEFRIGNEKRTMKPGDVAVIPGGVEHEGYFPEDSEAIDFFAPVREDFLTGAPPSYMAQL